MQAGIRDLKVPNCARTLDSLEYSLLSWPPNSPDLNSIENLWATVKRGHRKMLETEQRPHIAQGLFEQAVLEWEKIPQETIDGSIKRMPGRIQAVLDAYQMVE